MRFRVIDATPHPCPYLPAQTAVLPMRLPEAPIPPERFDELLAEGDRRSGPFLYRPSCPACRACEAIRIPIARFSPTASQKKVIRRNRDLTVEFARPSVTERHLEIYNRHKHERGLSDAGEELLEDDYRRTYVGSSVPTVEVRYLAAGRLIAFSILDVGTTSASSVYHCFDPDESRRSLGVFSVLAELERCRERGLTHYYLGLWVRDCRALAYKSTYLPHQRLIDGRWQDFDDAP